VTRRALAAGPGSGCPAATTARRPASLGSCRPRPLSAATVGVRQPRGEMAGATVAALTVEEVVQPVLRIVHGLVGVADGAGPVAQVILRRVRAPRLPLALLDARAALGRGSVGGAGGREALLRWRPRRRRGRRGRRQRRRGEGGRQRQQGHHHLTSPLQHPLSPSMRCCAQLGEVGMEVEGGTGGRGLWRTRAHAGLGLWRPCVMALGRSASARRAAARPAARSVAAMRPA
jgi:hypothetical protein